MSVDDVGVSPPVVVQRWRRYGHDRAYVKVDDVDLGYRDLKTGDVCCTDRAQLELVARATTALWERAEAARQPEYRPKHSAPDCGEASCAVVEAAPAEQPAPPVEPMEPASAPARELLTDRDLALNLPGQAAREQARQLRDAAPVRTLIARVVGVKTDERSWRIGADGEEEVARRLTRLGPDWRVLHAVPVGERGSDIDHVVIGPPGVFTINVKHHPQANVWVRGNTFKVNGFNQPYVRNSRHEATRAAKLLGAAAGFDVEVRGVIAVMGAHRGLKIIEQPRDGMVTITTRKELVAHLRTMPPVLGAPSIARIYDVARHLATWHPTTVRRQDFDSST